MQIFSNSKNFFTAGLLLLLFACNSNPDKEKTTDNKQTDTLIPSPPPTIPPTKVEMVPVVQKCYTNDGLKYKTVVTIATELNIVHGMFSSEELESNKIVKTEFDGTMNGDVLTIKFKGTPPVIGSSSEWTDKSWTIKKSGARETLLIVFNAKNYETNKWGETEYQFILVDCK